MCLVVCRLCPFSLLLTSNQVLFSLLQPSKKLNYSHLRNCDLSVNKNMPTCRNFCSPKSHMVRLRLVKGADFLRRGDWWKRKVWREYSREKGRQFCPMDKIEKGHAAELPCVWTFLWPVGHLSLHSPRVKSLSRDWEDWVSCYGKEKKEKTFCTAEMELNITPAFPQQLTGQQEH